eukprot:jgi/Botrbrau1/5167/Bobra.0172s0039.1
MVRTGYFGTLLATPRVHVGTAVLRDFAELPPDLQPPSGFRRTELQLHRDMADWREAAFSTATNTAVAAVHWSHARQPRSKAAETEQPDEDGPDPNGQDDPPLMPKVSTRQMSQGIDDDESPASPMVRERSDHLEVKLPDFHDVLHQARGFVVVEWKLEPAAAHGAFADEVPIARLKRSTHSYAHGGFMALAISMMSEPQWRKVLKDEDRSSYERAELLWQGTRTMRRRLLAALENSPILCAYGLVRCGCTTPKSYINPADLPQRAVSGSTLLSPKHQEATPGPPPPHATVSAAGAAGPAAGAGGPVAGAGGPAGGAAGPAAGAAERPAPPGRAVPVPAVPCAPPQADAREPACPVSAALHAPPSRSFSPMRIESANASANTSPTRGDRAFGIPALTAGAERLTLGFENLGIRPWGLPRRSHSDDHFSQRVSAPVPHGAYAAPLGGPGRLGGRMESMPVLQGGFEAPLAVGKERSALGQSALRVRAPATRWLPADEAGGVPVTPSMAVADGGDADSLSSFAPSRIGAPLTRAGSSFWTFPGMPDTPAARTPHVPVTPIRSWGSGRYSFDDGNIGAFNRAHLLGLLNPPGQRLRRNSLDTMPDETDGDRDEADSSRLDGDSDDGQYDWSRLQEDQGSKSLEGDSDDCTPSWSPRGSSNDLNYLEGTSEDGGLDDSLDGSSRDWSEMLPSTVKLGVASEEGDLHRVRKAAHRQYSLPRFCRERGSTQQVRIRPMMPWSGNLWLDPAQPWLLQRATVDHGSPSALVYQTITTAIPGLARVAKAAGASQHYPRGHPAHGLAHPFRASHQPGSERRPA